MGGLAYRFCNAAGATCLICTQIFKFGQPLTYKWPGFGKAWSVLSCPSTTPMLMPIPSLLVLTTYYVQAALLACTYSLVIHLGIPTTILIG